MTISIDDRIVKKVMKFNYLGVKINSSVSQVKGIKIVSGQQQDWMAQVFGLETAYHAAMQSRTH